MRRRSLLVGATSLGLGLAVLPVSRAFAAPRNPNVRIVYSYLAAWNFHDVERAAKHFAEDVVYFDASVGTPVTGKAAATSGVVANFIHAAPDLIWGIRGSPIAEDDQVAFEWAFSGTNSGEWADGTAATGKRFMFRGASVFTIRDGLIAEQSDYYDSLDFFRQLGWI